MRYHLHPPPAWVYLFDGRHRLVQSLRLVVGNLGHVGDQFLPGSAGSGFASSHARDFQYGPGVQFTSAEFTNRLKVADIRISWDGRGRALDNIFVERLWRSVKYEEVYIKDYQSVLDAVSNLRAYFTFYNQERLHQALDYQTPAQVYTSR